MKKLLTRLLLMSAVFTPLLFNSVDDVQYARAFGKLDTLSKETLANDPTQYIGYGFNVAGDKMLSETDALNLNSPILDVTNVELFDHVKTFDPSQTLYTSASSSSKQEMARNLSGQFGLDTTLTINKIHTKLGTHFDMDLGVGWTKTMQEEFSYYAIYARRCPVVLQLDTKDIRNYLNPKFQTALLNVKDPATAKSVLETYGTHLLTGYTLGGIFEMSNYYATNSSSYQRQATLGFKQQIEHGFSVNKNGTDFSFTAQYGAEDNNQYAKSLYKCTTYGGPVFAGLSIDQAFKWYEVPLYKADFVYGVWNDEINKGSNLVIVDIPQSSDMLPIWDLLPSSSDYAKTREYLVNAYIDLCGGALGAYEAQNRDVFPTDLNNKGAVESAKYVEKGYNYDYTHKDGTTVHSYIDTVANPKTAYNVHPNSVINMDFDISKVLNHKIEWKINKGNGSDNVTMVDNKLGIFKVLDKKAVNAFNVECYADGVQIFEQQFNITDIFSGGDGSKESPFLISQPLDLEMLSGRSDLWSTNTYFKLMNDINFDSNVGRRKPLGNIGTKEKPFKGHFDGNYFTINNLYLNVDPSTVYSGFISYNQGSLTNVTFNNTKNNELTRNNTVYSVDYSQDSTSKFGLEGAGIAVGYNDQSGVIDNVHVRNMYADIKLPAFKPCTYRQNVQLGGIAAVNFGTLKNASMEDCTLIFVAPEYEFVNVGGIVGLNETTYTLENCYCRDSYIYSEVGAYNISTPHNIYASAGGIVGRARVGTIKNCYAANFNDSTDTNMSHRIIAKVSAQDKFVAFPGGMTVRHNTHSGGIVGTVDVNDKNKSVVKFDNIITYNNIATTEIGISSILNIANSNGKEIGYKNTGVFFGYGYNENDYGSYVTNIYAEVPSGSYLSGSQLDRVPNEPAGCIKIQDCSWSNLPSTITYSKIWIEDVGNKATLAYKTVLADENKITLNTEDAKLVFFVGDPFVSGNLHIQAVLNDESLPFDVNDYFIDYSEFDSSKPGNYPIYVSVYGVKLKPYYVQVINPEVTNVVVAKEPTKVEYFENDIFDATGMELEIYKSDASHDVIKVTPDMVTTKAPLKIGVNNIGIVIGEYNFTYKVLGNARNVVSIEVTKQPTTTEYIVGVSTLNLDGLEVVAHYENGTQGVVDNDKLEVINPTITYGKNNIVVCYGTYKQASFTVTGTLDINNKLVQAFIAAVEDAETAQTLFDRKTSIKAAQEALKALGELESTDIFNYKKRLDKCVDEYNAIVGAVNNDFKENIKITCNISFGALISSGFDAATLIIIAIVKLF